MSQDNDVIVEGGGEEEDTVTPFMSDLAISVDFLNALDAGWVDFTAFPLCVFAKTLVIGT